MHLLPPSSLRIRLIAALSLLLAGSAAMAADWLTVASDRVRRVELDRASIQLSDAGTKVAWGRIVLSDDQAKAYGYRTVRALNRYDCRSHSFIIVKRVYESDNDTVLREDRIDASTPISVKTGTVDDRFFNEVCKPSSVAQLRDTARRAAESVARANEVEQPALRRADIKLTREEVPAAPTLQRPGPSKPQPDAAPAASPPQASTQPERKEPSIPASVLRKAEEAASSRPPKAAPPVAAESASSAQEAAIRASEQAARQAAAQAAALQARKPAAAITKPPAPPTSLAAWQAKAAAAAAVDEHLHWSYEGAGGPENWGKLDPGFSVCSNGKRQSPIDIRDGIKVDQEPIAFDYKPSYFRITDTGHTIQVTYGSGSQINVMGRSYDLVQLHFHHPAEERIDGKGFAMVAHLVHRDLQGRLAVVAVLIEPGKPHPLIQTLWNNLPLEQNEDYSPRVAIQVADLLPPSRDYISYMGSLTTPPCTEGVLWLVMKQPVQLSPEQIDVFARFYPHNARPIQPTAGRVIKESR